MMHGAHEETVEVVSNPQQEGHSPAAVAGIVAVETI